MRIVVFLLFVAAATAFTSPRAVTARKTAMPPLEMGLTIYGHSGSRSPLVNWACLELGIDFEMGDLSRNPHPFGQIPCLTDDDDVTVFESGAILQYLHNKHATGKMSPKAAGAVTSWITWANASLDPICFLETPEGKVYDTGLRKANRRIDRLEAILNEQRGSDGSIRLVPDAGFTSADVAVASYLLYVLLFFPDILKDMGQWPTVVEYMQQCAERPAYGEAFGKPTQANLVSKLQQAPGESKKLFGMF